MEGKKEGEEENMSEETSKRDMERRKDGKGGIN